MTRALYVTAALLLLAAAGVAAWKAADAGSPGWRPMGFSSRRPGPRPGEGGDHA